ncbi:MAG: hypothetical protein J0M29_07270 [Chitinophagales bacterium]|nr:hypothetical protein [Chitinophagales bacterium]
MVVSPPFGGAGNAALVQQLFEIICAASPDFDEKVLDKELVYQQLFPNQPWIQGKLDKLMVELVRLLRQYILISRYLSKPNEANVSLEWISWLREQGLLSRALLQMDKLNQEQQLRKEESLEEYELNYRIAREVHELQSLLNKNHDSAHIQDFLYHLELFYLNHKTEFQNRYRMIQKIKPLPDLPTDSPGLAFYSEKSLLFSITHRIELLLDNPSISPEDVFELLHTIQENEHRFSRMTHWQLLSYLRSLCTILLDNGQLDIIPVLLHLCKDNLERGLFSYHGLILPNAYMNIIQTAVKGKDLEWAIEVTESYKDLIAGGDKDKHYYRLNKAHCLFGAGQYDEALAILPIESLHHTVAGLARRLEVKICYELGSELLEYKLMAFRKQLERTGVKTSSNRINQMNLGFLNILKQIIESPKHNPRRVQQLLDRIQKKKLLSDRLWLMEKAAALNS